MTKKLDLDIDEGGRVLPTLRNQDTFQQLINEHGIDWVLANHHDNYISYSKSVMFNPASGNIMYRTKEQAMAAQARAAKIAELDAAYTTRKQSVSPKS